MADQHQGDFIAGLITGAIVGGIVGGVIGVTVATRLRRSAADPEDESAPRSSAHPTQAQLQEIPEAENEAITQARRTLEEKIAQLNEAIQDTRAQLLVHDSVESD